MQYMELLQYHRLILKKAGIRWSKNFRCWKRQFCPPGNFFFENDKTESFWTLLYVDHESPTFFIKSQPKFHSSLF